MASVISSLLNDASLDVPESPSDAPPASPISFSATAQRARSTLRSSSTKFSTSRPAVAVSHLSEAHGIGIVDLKSIMPFFESYVTYYAREAAAAKEKGKGVLEGLQGVRRRVENNTTLYLLGGTPADTHIRATLRHQKLQETLLIQDRERHDDDVERKCLFCRQTFSGHKSRSGMFAHMFDVHGFSIGLVDNLVFVDEYLALLASMLESLQCLYCEKTFKSPPILRKHMRKKKHFKINPRNPTYDRFYIINYAQSAIPHSSSSVFGGASTPTDSRSERTEEEEDERWDDWLDGGVEGDQTMCLFDESVWGSAVEAVEHMKEAHGFDLRKLKRDLGLDVYHTIKLINYIRRQTSFHTCFSCRTTFDTLAEMCEHMEKESHFALVSSPSDPPTNGETLFWNDAQYLLPTYENDPLMTLDLASDDEDDIPAVSSASTQSCPPTATNVVIHPEQNALSLAAARRAGEEGGIDAFVRLWVSSGGGTSGGSVDDEQEELAARRARDEEEMREVGRWRHDRVDDDEEDVDEDNDGDDGDEE